jgi:hypothetical protein
MARQARAPQYFGERARQPHPLQIIGATMQGVGGTISDFVNQRHTASALTTQTALGQAELADREAQNRQAFAQLVELARQGQLPPEAGAQVSSAVAGLGDARQRINTDARLAEAPIALAGVKGARRMQGVVGDIDRRIAELEAPPQIAPGQASAPLLDPETRAAQISQWKTLRAAVASGDPESASQFATLSVQMGLTGAQGIEAALNAERIRGVRNQREADRIATEQLGREFPQMFGELAAAGVGSEGAAATLFNLNEIRERGRVDSRLIREREASERRLMDREHQLRLQANAMAAYEGLLVSAYSKTGSPTEALANATRMLESVNPELASTLRENGQLSYVERLVDAQFEAQGYLQHILTKSAEVRQQNVERETERAQSIPGGGAVTGRAGGLPVRGTARVDRRTQLNVDSTVGAVLDHLMTTMQLDRETATMIMQRMDARGIVENYNRSAREAFNRPASESEIARGEGRLQHAPEVEASNRARFYERNLRANRRTGDSRAGGGF